MSHILIVEDDPRISSFIVKGLKSAGYLSTVEQDGPAAFALAQTLALDLIILDIGLPGMDGFTVMQKLRANGVNTPIIMLTARDSVTDTVQGLETGANDYMTKPFQFAELLARIRLRLAAPPHQRTPPDPLSHTENSPSTCSPDKSASPALTPNSPPVNSLFSKPSCGAPPPGTLPGTAPRNGLGHQL